MTANPHQAAPARRYRIERYLTEGGMGAIYIGKKLGPGGFEKEVVLKQLLPEYTARPEFRDLFFREAKISATLDHANIVHTFDLVESEESLFIVMEYVRGVDLRTIIRRAKLRRRELAPAAALHIALEVLAGLGYAHTRRAPTGSSMAIIHRDVSPSNILCSAQGEVKLSDFGIAKAATHSSVFYRVRGKVGYMSPEQARSEAIDHRSDLYSLAVCLYEALTAERLFVGDLSTPADAIYSQPIVPLSEKRPGLPRALDTVLATALSPRPEDRYQDGAAFAQALRQVAHRHGLSFSAPKLAEHLRFILGRDPTQWLTEEGAVATGDPSTQKIPAKELEGKEAKSIGVVGEAENLYVVGGGGVVSPPTVGARNVGSGPPPSFSPFGPAAGDEDIDADETTRRLADPSKAAEGPFDDEEPTRRVEPPVLVSSDVPIHDELSGSDGDPGPTPGPTPPPPRMGRTPDPGPTPPPPRLGRTSPDPALTPAPPRLARAVPPPPPRQAFSPPPPLPPESPFDVPETPGPAATEEEFPPTPPPAMMTGPSPFAATAYAPPPSTGRPPPGRPRPNGYQDGQQAPGGYGASGFGAGPHLPPAPQASHLPPAPPPAIYDPSNTFDSGPVPPYNLGRETVDFGRFSEPVPVVPPRKSGPPGLVVLIVLLAAAAGGAKLAEVVTRGDVAALDARHK